MTPERNLIEAVFGATLLDPTDEQIDAILTTPAVQAALAKVRDREPVLRWEGYTEDYAGLYLGEIEAAAVLNRGERGFGYMQSGLLIGSETFPTEAEARTAAEQAVRDWLKRAGCV